MNGPREDLPERLLEGDATAFERRVLENALGHGPPRETSLRMARALGVGMTTVTATPTVTRTAAAKATVTAKATAPAAMWPWVAAGVLALSVAGVVVGTRGGSTSPPAASAPAPALPSVSAAPATAPEILNPTVAPQPVTAMAPSPPHPVALGPDLRGEIELLDGARAATAAKSGRRALEILRRYQDRYPSGNFLPEATAVQVEALMQLGRTDEARALATRFVAEHKGTVLGERVAALAGLPRP